MINSDDAVPARKRPFRIGNAVIISSALVSLGAVSPQALHAQGGQTFAQRVASPSVNTAPSGQGETVLDLGEPVSAIRFQREGDARPTVVEIKPGERSFDLVYTNPIDGKSSIIARYSQDDYAAVGLQGPITLPADAKANAPGEPVSIRKGAPLYALVIAKTRATDCTHEGSILDVSGPVPSKTSPFALCSPDMPQVALRSDRTLVINSQEYTWPGTDLKQPAKRYEYKTGYEDYREQVLPPPLDGDRAKKRINPPSSELSL